MCFVSYRAGRPQPYDPAMRSTCLCLLLLLALGPLTPADAKEKAPETGKVVAMTTTKHERAWSLYVPSKYSKKKSWPLVISSHGRGGSGKGEMRAWQALANKHGFIVACPDMVTATNHRPAKSSLAPSEEDDQVLLEIFATVSKHFRVNRRAVMVTGFSGGGNPSYHSGLGHPEVFTHICTRGGNFAPQQVPYDEKVLEAGRKHLRIYIFFGDKDHVLIVGNPDGTGQAFTARDALKKAGYENIEFERVQGMKHQSRPDKAAAWFGAYLQANAKAFKAADKVDGMLSKAEAALAKGKPKDAVKQAIKARDLERKSKLKELSADILARLEKRGREALEQATAAHEGGDVKGALKAAASIKRDYKGLPVADEAAKLEKAWKAP